MNEVRNERNELSSSAWLCVSFGGGTNSSAMLCGFKERGIRPDLIMMADTGAEHPHTYEHLKVMQRKVKDWWGLEIEVVRAKKTILEHCHDTKLYPSLAYGRRSCSQKFKHEPMEKRLAELAKGAGVTRITKAIGYDAGESRHLGKPESKELRKGIVETYWYPLLEWGWKRDDCQKAICRNKLPKPGKSSCYICPAMRSNEIIALNGKHPELMKKALDLEVMVNTGGKQRHKMGLGGREIMWADILKQDDEQMKLLDFLEQYDAQHLPCGCSDGT